MRTATHEDVVDALDGLTRAARASQVQMTERLDGFQEQIDRIETEVRRPGGGGGKNHGSVEMRAWEEFLRRGPDAVDRKNALTLSDDTAGGGYLAPDQFIADLARNVVLFSPIRQLARVTQISAGAAIMPRRTGRMTGVWVGETQARSSTQPTYGQDRFDVREMACFTDISNSQLEDSAFDMLAELTLDYAEEFGRLEGAGFVNGAGPLQPEGFMTNPDVPSVNSGAATAISADALIDMQQTLPQPYRGSAVWVCNGISCVSAIRKLKDGEGRYLLESVTSGMAQAPSLTLLGRPLVEAPDMPDIGAGSYPLILADWQQFYRVFDRVALSVMRDPYSVATSGLTRFHARRRVAGGVRKSEAAIKLKISA